MSCNILFLMRQFTGIIRNSCSFALEKFVDSPKMIMIMDGCQNSACKLMQPPISLKIGIHWL